MRGPRETIVQVDVSITGIPTSVKIASAGYKVIFATTSDYVAAQLKEYRSSLHRVPKSLFTKLLLGGMLMATTDIESALASSKTILVTSHALGIEEEMEAVMNLFKQMAPHITPNSLLVYGGLAPPGTMEGVINILERYSRLDTEKDISVALITPFEAQAETYIVCSPKSEAANIVKKFMSTFVPSNMIKLYRTFKEAETANLLLIAKQAIMKALSSYALLLFKQMDVNVEDALSLSECKAPTVIEDDPISQMVMNYLVSEERRLPQRLMLMRNIIRTKIVLLRAITTNLRREVKLALQRSKGLTVACVFERESDKELVSTMLPKKGVKVHFYNIDEIEPKVEAGAERIIPFKVNLIILAVHPQNISERTICRLKEETKLIDLGRIISV
ncbi:MAG: hypothetical protein QXO01_00765 [Nitrososphaerota archaeon]